MKWKQRVCVFDIVGKTLLNFQKCFQTGLRKKFSNHGLHLKQMTTETLTVFSRDVTG